LTAIQLVVGHGFFSRHGSGYWSCGCDVVTHEYYTSILRIINNVSHMRTSAQQTLDRTLDGRLRNDVQVDCEGRRHYEYSNQFYNCWNSILIIPDSVQSIEPQMVRMSRKNTLSKHRQSYQSFKIKSNLFSQNFFTFVLFGVVFLTINFYIVFRRIEAKSESSSAEKESVRISLDGQIEYPTKSTPIRGDQIVNSPKSDIMIPGTSVLSASRVISSGLPFLVYGTAWKKDNTEALVAQAVRSGFRFVDTACQPKHYNEPGVGKGWTLAATELGLHRSDLFIQTKYTSISGQDPKNIPYDPSKSLEDRVEESLKVSLHNLKTSYLDSWVMHSPEQTLEETMVAYRVMENAVDDGKVLRLGISNCYDYDLFVSIYEMARIKPSVLQNRFYGDSNWDQELRQFCKENNIWYQSFWTLTANLEALATQEVRAWALSKKLTPQTLMYAYLMSLGYGTPLDGTTSLDHMKEDQALVIRMHGGEKIFANEDEIKRFERILGF
jgi:diketogulonate reductase-like aldo/keto reductase